MPSQPSSAGTESVRLAHVFVRLPKEHQQPNVKTPAPDGPKADSSDTTTPSKQEHHRPSAPKEEKENEPTTPQKPPKTFNPHIQTHHLPPTPSPTPTKNLKRHSPPTGIPSPQTPSLKRHRTTAHPTPPRSPPRRLLRASSSTPKFSIVYQPEAAHEEEEDAVSWVELKRVAESVMRQVDWEGVAENVASNRSAGVYKRVVRGVLQKRIDELFEREEGER